MISHSASKGYICRSGRARELGSCVELPCWSHGARVIATRRHSSSRGRRSGVSRGQPWTRTGAGRQRRGMGWRASDERTGQQRLNWRGGIEWGNRLVWVKSRRGGSFGLHWVVGWLVSHARADPRHLMQGCRSLCRTCRPEKGKKKLLNEWAKPKLFVRVEHKRIPQKVNKSIAFY